MADNAYSDLKLHGNFSDDGETFLITADLNGTPIRVANIYVGDQREAFQAAHDAGQEKASGRSAKS